MKLYLLVGVPCSGKSTWAHEKIQTELKDCVYISTDTYVEAEAARQGKYYSEVFDTYMPTAVSLMLDDVEQARLDGKNIIWDQTSITIASRKKKFIPGYDIIAVVFPTPESFTLERRLKSRPGKVIPFRVMNQMIDNYEAPSPEEGFSEIWIIK